MTDQQPVEGASVGSTLRELRRERGWTLRRLRQETGISIPYLSMIERDDVSRPSREKLEVIAEALGADPSEVLREHDKADLVNRLGFDPVLAEFVLRLREATPEERDQLSSSRSCCPRSRASHES